MGLPATPSLLRRDSGVTASSLVAVVEDNQHRRVAAGTRTRRAFVLCRRAEKRALFIIAVVISYKDADCENGVIDM